MPGQDKKSSPHSRMRTNRLFEYALKQHKLKNTIIYLEDLQIGNVNYPALKGGACKSPG